MGLHSTDFARKMELSATVSFPLVEGNPMIEIIFYSLLLSLCGVSIFFQLRECVRIAKKSVARKDATKLDKAKQETFEKSFYN